MEGLYICISLLDSEVNRKAGSDNIGDTMTIAILSLSEYFIVGYLLECVIRLILKEPRFSGRSFFFHDILKYLFPLNAMTSKFELTS